MTVFKFANYLIHIYNICVVVCSYQTKHYDKDVKSVEIHKSPLLPQHLMYQWYKRYCRIKNINVEFKTIYLKYLQDLWKSDEELQMLSVVSNHVLNTLFNVRNFCIATLWSNNNRYTHWYVGNLDAFNRFPFISWSRIILQIQG